ncbi:glycosyltransferase family 2 protein [Calothrix sp. UHCC 0171]|uniref:glycosyltransferase family 2 protein n=1 Tax=Calothrix sp. UHCC 0171 TaxID=3110245 RepID=UPI002B1FE5F5|nr:glycosyltransferase [Calothrix sp. UHCC 0171]MEA5571603.1 glycosyltransferase [Calothrix sp. UHCC 0171]
MRISACITTRNRPEALEACLKALWNSTTQPNMVIVSDDSPIEEIQQINSDIVNKYPGTKYILGPRIGVCGNRNNAVNAIPPSETDFVAFVDDDICVEPNYLTQAREIYQKMSVEEQQQTILSGVSRNPQGKEEMMGGELNFRGYFRTTRNTPQTVAIHATLFPRVFFEQEQWDENIFFGYEDAELSLRALQRGYKIKHCPELRVIHPGENGVSVLDIPDMGTLTNYEISIEAARLYVGIKRYKDLFPSPLKLIIFLVMYFVHMTFYLFRRRTIQALPEIVRRSRIHKLWQPSLSI